MSTMLRVLGLLVPTANMMPEASSWCETWIAEKSSLLQIGNSVGDGIQLCRVDFDRVTSSAGYQTPVRPGLHGICMARHSNVPLIRNREDMLAGFGRMQGFWR